MTENESVAGEVRAQPATSTRAGDDQPRTPYSEPTASVWAAELFAVPDWAAPRSRPLLKLRQWWCGRRHDKGRRFHDWEMIDQLGSIRCRRCRIVLGGMPGQGPYMRDALADFRKDFPHG